MLRDHRSLSIFFFEPDIALLVMDSKNYFSDSVWQVKRRGGTEEKRECP